MPRVIALTVVALLLFAMGASQARPRHHFIDATPFSHAPCSVMSTRPCTPFTCSVFNHGPCVPEIDYPYGENLQLTIESATKYAWPDHDLNTIADLFAALRACWAPPPENEAQQDMQISVRFSFRRSGAIFGAPQVTYSKRDASPEIRKAYQNAIASSLAACAPLPFTRSLGGALAGQPILARYVDNRRIGNPPTP